MQLSNIDLEILFHQSFIVERKKNNIFPSSATTAAATAVLHCTQTHTHTVTGYNWYSSLLMIDFCFNSTFEMVERYDILFFF